MEFFWNYMITKTLVSPVIHAKAAIMLEFKYTSNTFCYGATLLWSEIDRSIESVTFMMPTLFPETQRNI